MSLTPGFAPDAKSQWKALDLNLQEMVLDEMERVALDPPSPGEHVLDVVWETGPVLHALFFYVIVDRDRNSVTLIGVGYVARPGG